MIVTKNAGGGKYINLMIRNRFGKWITFKKSRFLYACTTKMKDYSGAFNPGGEFFLLKNPAANQGQ